ATRLRLSPIPKAALLIGFNICYPLFWCFSGASGREGLSPPCLLNAKSCATRTLSVSESTRVGQLLRCCSLCWGGGVLFGSSRNFFRRRWKLLCCQRCAARDGGIIAQFHV